MNFNEAGNQISSVFSTFGEKLKPFGASVGKGFTQMQQFAKEKLGNTADVTELPAEYKELEEKVDRIQMIHQMFLKVARNYTLPHYDYEPPLKETVFDFATTVGDKATSFADRMVATAGGSQSSPLRTSQTPPETPSGLSHAFARSSYQSADLLGPEDPFGAALKKFGNAHEKIGNFRLAQDADAVSKFYNPWLHSLEELIGQALKSRKRVQAVRLTYDAFRAKVKSARPEHADAARQDMENAEDEFVAAVDEAMGKMKIVIESPELLKALADLVAIQLQYFKAATEVLSELSPEMDELVVTNEAILNHPTI